MLRVDETIDAEQILSGFLSSKQQILTYPHDMTFNISQKFRTIFIRVLSMSSGHDKQSMQTNLQGHDLKVDP